MGFEAETLRTAIISRLSRVIYPHHQSGDCLSMTVLLAFYRRRHAYKSHIRHEFIQLGEKLTPCKS